MKKYDVILITPDAYVDHPAFAHALLKHNLIKAGYSVAVIDRPKWQEKEYFKFGTPNLFWAVSGGNVDSVVLNYTASGKKRKTDAYQENGNAYFPGMPKGEKSRIRPDRCINVYVNGIKSKDKTTPIVIGGIEASLRRFAHYDFLSKKVRASVLVQSGADMLIYGMGEKTIIQTAKSLKDGQDIKSLNINGTCRLLSKDENFIGIELPSFDEVRENKTAFVEMTEIIYKNQNPYIAKPLMQVHSGRRLVQFPPAMPLTTKEIDDIYNHNFDFGKNKTNIPALRMIQNSITSHRGCFGGCSFCALTVHQGKNIVSRSETSILDEIKKKAAMPKFNRVISDIGGPSAEMYKYVCENKTCERISCLYPDVCKNISSRENGLAKLYKKALGLKNKNGKKFLKHVFVGSGLRYDLLSLYPEVFEFVVCNNVSGYLKVAPEHSAAQVLKLMNKPDIKVFEKFLNKFKTLSKKAGKKQFVIPYLIIGHPGETREHIYNLKDFLKKHNLKAEQVQIFTPTPMTLSTGMYYTGIVPFTREKVETCKDIKELEYRKKTVLGK